MPEDSALSIGDRARRGSIERRLAAVLGVDIRDFSLLMASNEESTHSRVRAAMDRLGREIIKSRGRVISDAGDGLMAEFPSAVEALKCALRIQRDAAKRNVRLTPDKRIDYRMGINVGEVVSQQGRAGGTTVNVAARLEQIADPGGIFLSATVFEQCSGVVHVGFEPVGERRLKNIPQSVMIYRIAPQAYIAAPTIAAASRAASSPLRTASEDYRPSLAVLPFRTLQADQSDAYFAEGMVDDIIRLLGGLKDLVVISRSATLGYAGAPHDLRRIGNELDVRYVLHGSLRRADNRIRIAVELSEAKSGHVIWADRLDGELLDLFDLQDRIAMQVVNAVAPQVWERELGRGKRKHPGSMTAYDLTLQALDQLYRMDQTSFYRSRELLREALVHDPGYAPAYTQTAFWYLNCFWQGWSQDTAADMVNASSAAQAAMEYDRGDALGLAVYGHTQAYLHKNYVFARDILDQALAAGPSCAWAYTFSSFTCGYLGDYKTSLLRAELAVRLSPLGPHAYFHEHALSQAFYMLGQYDKAITWGQLSASHCATHAPNLRCLIASLVAAGNMVEARNVAQKLLDVEPAFTITKFRARTPLTDEVKNRFSNQMIAAGVPD